MGRSRQVSLINLLLTQPRVEIKIRDIDAPSVKALGFTI